jgi:hypothetical protein
MRWYSKCQKWFVTGTLCGCAISISVGYVAPKYLDKPEAVKHIDGQAICKLYSHTELEQLVVENTSSTGTFNLNYSSPFYSQ